MKLKKEPPVMTTGKNKDIMNTLYTPIEITPDMAFEIWGVVNSVIHKV